MIDKSLPATIKDDAKRKILEIMHLFVENKLDIIMGSREVSGLVYRANLQEDKIFLSFLGVASETEDIPLGEVRNAYSKEYLKARDREAEEYTNNVKNNIIEAANKVITKYSTIKNTTI